MSNTLPGEWGVRLVGPSGAPVPAPATLPSCWALKATKPETSCNTACADSSVGPSYPTVSSRCTGSQGPRGAPGGSRSRAGRLGGDVAAHTPHPHGLCGPGPWTPGCGDSLREGWRYPQAPTWPPQRHSDSAAPTPPGATLHPAWAQLQPTGQCSREPDRASGQMHPPHRRRGLRRGARLSQAPGPQ